MLELTIDAHEVNEVIDDLGNSHYLHDPMEAGLALLHDDMARYPAPPSGSTYRRTGDYGRAFTERIVPQGNGLYGELGNAVRSRRTGRGYGPYVGDEHRQAKVHQGRWRTDLEAMQRNEPQIRSYFDQALQRVADR